MLLGCPKREESRFRGTLFSHNPIWFWYAKSCKINLQKDNESLETSKNDEETSSRIYKFMVSLVFVPPFAQRSLHPWLRRFAISELGTSSS